MAKSRAKGEGTWYEPAKGGFAFVVTTGWDPVKKKQHRKAFYGRTRKECLAKWEAWKEEEGEVTGPDSTVGRAVQEWLRSRKDQVDPASLDVYEDHLTRVDDALRAVPLSKVTVKDVELWMGRLEGVPAPSRRNSFARLKAALRHQVRLGNLKANPCDWIRPPRAPGHDIRPLGLPLVAGLLRACRTPLERAVFRLALDSGMRQGEILALTPDSFLAATGEVIVRKSLQYRADAAVPKDVKTKHGRRRIPLTPETKEALIEQIRASGDPERVFPDPREGGWWKKSRFYRWVRRFFRDRGVPPFRFHDLRHTCASMLLLANLNPKVVSERLGHASVVITLDTYSHLLPGTQEAAVTALEGFLK